MPSKAAAMMRHGVGEVLQFDRWHIGDTLSNKSVPFVRRQHVWFAHTATDYLAGGTMKRTGGTN